MSTAHTEAERRWPDNVHTGQTPLYSRMNRAAFKEGAEWQRQRLLEQIEWLMAARHDYSNEPDDKIDEHMHVVKHLLAVLKDEEFAAEGWLPVKHWDEWKERRDDR